jgi:DNA-binding response OmpR family regulator
MSAAPQHVLLVEDDFLIADLIEDMLAELGYDLTGSAQRLDAALALARSEPFQFGLLDLQVGGATTYAVADILMARGIPFAFVTGRSAADIAPPYAGLPVLQKPFRFEDLAATIARLASVGPSDPGR